MILNRRHQLVNCINLSSNELHHHALDDVFDSAITQVDYTKVMRYPNYGDYVQKISDILGLSPHHLLITPGTDSAIRLIVEFYKLQFGPEGKLLLPYPNYFAWEQAARRYDLEVDAIEIDPFENDFGEMINLARSSINTLIALTSPSGPIGGWISEPDLAQLIQVVESRGHILVIDSCYQAFMGDIWGRFSLAKGRVLVLQSLSKSHGFAGERVGFLAGEANLIQSLFASNIEHHVSATSLELASHLLEQQRQFEPIWQDVQHQRAFAAQLLTREGFRVVPSGGNFLVIAFSSSQDATRITDALFEAGYRVKHLKEYSNFDHMIRFTIGDADCTQSFLSCFFNLANELGITS